MVFSFYAIFCSFTHCEPADGFKETILVKGAGLDIGGQIWCHINKTDVTPVSISEDVIQCPMCLKDKDPHMAGYLQFALNFVGTFNDFGDSIGQATLVQAGTIKCIVEEGEGLIV